MGVAEGPVSGMNDSWINQYFIYFLKRPTAKELLKHKFIIRNSRKTSYLTELIDRYKRWKAEQNHEDSSSGESDS